jgi:hypothetical protein
MELKVLASPFRFDTQLSSEDFEKLGRLAMRWSHIDHMIANCLKRQLGLDDDQARIMIFPLSTEVRLQRMKALGFQSAKATEVFRELSAVMKGIRTIRNNVAHAVWIDGRFMLRSKEDRAFGKEEIFEVEELTNYVGILALTLRNELGEADPEYKPPDPLPERPPIPGFLKRYIAG